MRVENCVSSKYEVLSGMPHGSMLGPLLFLCIVQCSISLFADDTKIFGNPCNSAHLIRNDLNSVQEWSNVGLATLNSDKFIVLHIGSKTHDRDITDNVE